VYCVAKVFAGNVGLFENALAHGEVYLGANGKYYYDETHNTHDEIRSSTTKAEELLEVAPGDIASVFAMMIANKPDPKEKWLSIASEHIAPPSDKYNDPATDHDMAILQESFDSVTRVTSAIRKVGMEIIKTGASSTSSELATKGLGLCKAIVASQEIVEELLFCQRCDVTASQVRNALMSAAKPYKELIVYYNELVAVHRHVLSGQSSSSGSRFKAMQA
jgi:hypothetical protein